MIPKRQGVANAMASIPVSDGQLPPPPVPGPDSAFVLNNNPQNIVPTPTGANGILEALQKFRAVTKVTIIEPGMANTLTKKGLIVVVEGNAVVSEKGLGYLVDFNLIT